MCGLQQNKKILEDALTGYVDRKGIDLNEEATFGLFFMLKYKKCYR